MGNDAELRERVAVLESQVEAMAKRLDGLGKVKRAGPREIAIAVAIVVGSLTAGGVSISLGRAEQATAAVQAKVQAYAPPVVSEGSGLE